MAQLKPRKLLSYNKFKYKGVCYSYNMDTNRQSIVTKLNHILNYKT